MSKKLLTCSGCNRRLLFRGGKGKSGFAPHKNAHGVACYRRKPGGGPVTGETVYEWKGEVGVVEPFASVLAEAGKQYFNHGGLLRVLSDEDGHVHELHAGDMVLIDHLKRVRVLRAKPV